MDHILGGALVLFGVIIGGLIVLCTVFFLDIVKKWRETWFDEEEDEVEEEYSSNSNTGFISKKQQDE